MEPWNKVSKDFTNYRASLGNMSHRFSIAQLLRLSTASAMEEETKLRRSTRARIHEDVIEVDPMWWNADYPTQPGNTSALTFQCSHEWSSGESVELFVLKYHLACWFTWPRDYRCIADFLTNNLCILLAIINDLWPCWTTVDLLEISLRNVLFHLPQTSKFWR